MIGHVALVDAAKVGMGLTVFVSIRTSEHSAEWLGHFAESASAMPEVVAFYRMAGDVDYMLRVLVRDMAALKHAVKQGGSRRSGSGRSANGMSEYGTQAPAKDNGVSGW